MAINPRAKRRWHTLTLSSYSSLEREGRTGELRLGDRFQVCHRGLELVAFSVRGHRGVWYVPLNNDLWVADITQVETVHPRRLATSEEEANDHNTSLFTCRHCGNWLKASDDGYGTEHGWCGCKEPS